MEDVDVRIRDSCSARKILLPYPASQGVEKAINQGVMAR
jgi:hypothetical protein